MLIDALKNWAELGLAEQPILLKEFSDGLNHQCGLIESGEQKFVAKFFQHSFNKCLRAEYFASEAGVAPQIFSAANNLSIYQYILGLSLDHYLEDAPDSMISWHTLLTPLINEFCQDPTPLVFCHNDLVKENCLFDAQQAWLIDWEFAQLNNPWFDLGSIVLWE